MLRSLVREESTEKLEMLITEKWTPAIPTVAERIKPVIGDLAKPRLGLWMRRWPS